MRYAITSDIGDLIGEAFFDGSNDLSFNLVSETATQLVYTNTSTGATTTLIGSNLSTDNDGNPVGIGTEIQVRNDDGDIGSITDIAWDLETLLQSLQNIALAGNATGLSTLINDSAPIVIDARGATDFVNFEQELQNVVRLVNTGVTFLDSPFSADVVGTVGDDTFEIRGSDARFTSLFVEASLGDDTYDVTGVAQGAFMFLDYDQDYSQTVLPITVTIDFDEDDATIETSDFTDTIIDVGDIMSADGLFIAGSRLDDTFAIDARGGQFAAVRGGEGVDTYDLTVGSVGNVRVSFEFGANANPTQAAVVNLGTGMIANDGFGNSETITIDNVGRGFIEVLGTEFGDSLTGSDEDDRLSGMLGNDTIDGGDGQDAVSYAFGIHQSVNLNLSEGTATVLSSDNVTETDTLISIEQIIATGGNDTAIGSANSDALFMNRGDDSATGLAGNDWLEGNVGNDTLSGGLGDDIVNGGEGEDLLRGNAGEDTLNGGNGDDELRGQRNADTLQGGDGDDNLKGGGGNDVLIGGNGNDFLNGGTRQDSIEGGAGNDKLIGRSFSDTLLGGAGDDALNAGGDDDRLEGGSGNDFVKGGTGIDTFVFDIGFEIDRVADFTFADDRLEITTALANGRTAAEIADLVVETGGDTELDFGNGDIMRLLGVTDLPDLETRIDIV